MLNLVVGDKLQYNGFDGGEYLEILKIDKNAIYYSYNNGNSSGSTSIKYITNLIKIGTVRVIKK